MHNTTVELLRQAMNTTARHESSMGGKEENNKEKGKQKKNKNMMIGTWFCSQGRCLVVCCS